MSQKSGAYKSLSPEVTNAHEHKRLSRIITYVLMCIHAKYQVHKRIYSLVISNAALRAMKLKKGFRMDLSCFKGSIHI